MVIIESLRFSQQFEGILEQIIIKIFIDVKHHLEVLRLPTSRQYLCQDQF